MLLSKCCIAPPQNNQELFKHVFRELNTTADACASRAHDVTSFCEVLVPVECWPRKLCAHFDGSKRGTAGATGYAIFGVPPAGPNILLCKGGRIISGYSRSSTWVEAHALRHLISELRHMLPHYQVR